MSKHSSFQDINIRSHYILTGSHRTPIEDIVNMVERDDEQWKAQSRRMRARRWQKINGSED